MKKLNLALSTFLYFGLISCGQNSNVTKNIMTIETPASPEGEYEVILRPLNNHLSGWIPNGKSDIKINNGQISLYSWLDDAAPEVHHQFILTGKRCPNQADDRNGDGVIDIRETFKVSGKILIPLDNNLRVQNGLQDQFPFGNFSYNQKTDLKSIEEDLKNPDLNPNDFFVKLNRDDSFNLENKVMIILGINRKTTLPLSIQGFDLGPSHLSIPIVCGLIKKSPLQ